MSILQNVMDASSHAMFTMDRSGIVTNINRQAKEQFGLFNHSAESHAAGRLGTGDVVILVSPYLGGDDGQWVYDRIMVVNCPNVIPKEKQDKQLLDKMYAERDGIVYKANTALQRVITNGYRFSEPASVAAARKAYKSTNSTVISFFEECMCPWQNGKINRHCTTGRIYKVYQAWCRENNNGYAKSTKEFREELADYLDTTFTDMTSRQKSNTYYRDYSLTLETKEQFAREYGYDDGTDFL